MGLFRRPSAAPGSKGAGDGRATTGAGPLDGPDERFTSVVTLTREQLGCERAGIAVRGAEGRAVTLAASHPLVEEADRLQTRLADGPAVSPAWPTSQVAIPDLTAHRHWPAWSRALEELGIHAVLATQIVTPEGRTGSLTLYDDGRDEGAASRLSFAAQELATARVLARWAGTELTHAHTVGRLTTAVQARSLVGQAQGILMERFGFGAEEAFAVLERQAHDTDSKLSEVSRSLVATCDLGSGSLQDQR